jgi:hypothetical protein
MQSACAVYCHLWPVCDNLTSAPYLTQGTIFGLGWGWGELLNVKCVCFAIALSETIPIFRRTERDITISLHRPSCGVSCEVLMKLEFFFFLDRFSKNSQISKFHENTSSRSKVVSCRRKDGQADRQTEMTK